MRDRHAHSGLLAINRIALRRRCFFFHQFGPPEMLAPISAELIALMFLPVKQTESADKKFMTGQARRDFPAQISFDFATFRFDTLNFFLVSATALLSSQS